MRTKRPNRRRTQWIVRGLLLAIALAAVASAGLWLAFERVPSWYAPIEVSQAELTRVRNSLPNTYQSLSDNVITGAPFEISISERTVTEWVVARGELYPEARTWLPDWLRDPVVCFREGRCIIAARVDYEGWQTILGIHIAFDIADDVVTARVAKLTAGALPIPLSRLSGPLADLLSDKRLDAALLPDPIAKVIQRLQIEGPSELITNGASWPNHFEMRSGRRQVKLREVQTANGALTVRLEPH